MSRRGSGTGLGRDLALLCCGCSAGGEAESWERSQNNMRQSKDFPNEQNKPVK